MVEINVRMRVVICNWAVRVGSTVQSSQASSDRGSRHTHLVTAVSVTRSPGCRSAGWIFF